MIYYRCHIDVKGVEKTMAKIMTVRPPEKLQAKIKELAKEKGFSLNAQILQILWEWVDKRKER